MLVVCFFYLLLTIFGYSLILWRKSSSFLFDPLGFPLAGGLIFLVISFTIVLIVHFLSRGVVGQCPSLKESARELNNLLGEMKSNHVFVIALLSGIGEEVFFRGWLLNEIGVIASSLIFGIVHWPPNKNWIFWPFFAFGMGIILAALCVWTNNLVYAVIVHAGINFLNLRILPNIIKSE